MQKGGGPDNLLSGWRSHKRFSEKCRRMKNGGIPETLPGIITGVAGPRRGAVMSGWQRHRRFMEKSSCHPAHSPGSSSSGDSARFTKAHDAFRAGPHSVIRWIFTQNGRPDIPVGPNTRDRNVPTGAGSAYQQMELTYPIPACP